MEWIWKRACNVLISLFNETDECVFPSQASFCWQRRKSNCVSVCVWERRVQGWRRRDWVSGPDNQFSFLRPLERGVGMSPSDRTPFPTIKPSKNIPFVSVTAPTHRSHSAMSVDYVALQFTSATDNIISLIMSYGLLLRSDVCSSAHGPFTYSRFSQRDDFVGNVL